MSETRVPLYKSWDDIPEGIATKTTLYRDHGMKVTKDQAVVGLKTKYNHRGKPDGFYELYDIADCEPKKKATPAQIEALEKARYMAEKLDVKCSKCGDWQFNRYGDVIKVTRKQWMNDDYDNWTCHICSNRQLAVQWATEMLMSGFLILDTETSDLDGEIIEIAIIDHTGDTLMNQRIKPAGTISAGAQRVHCISLEDLADCPSFPDVYPQIKSLIENRTVLIYNAAFDTRRLLMDCYNHKLEPIEFNAECVMLEYAAYVGEWSDYHDDYRWQPLNGGHSALSDCRATLDRIKEMAVIDG